MSILLERRQIHPFEFEVELPRAVTRAWLKKVSDEDLEFIRRQLESWLPDERYVGSRRSSFTKVLCRQIERVKGELIRREQLHERGDGAGKRA